MKRNEPYFHVNSVRKIEITTIYNIKFQNYSSPQSGLCKICLIATDYHYSDIVHVKVYKGLSKC